MGSWAAHHPRRRRRLSLSKIRSALKPGGRQRNSTPAPAKSRCLGTEQLSAAAAVSAAFEATTRAAVGIIAELNHQISELEAELATHFQAHPDADIFLSLPGLGDILRAGIGGSGDDPNRFADAKSRKNYAGTSPLTVASGKNARRPATSATAASRRHRPLGLRALTRSPGARALDQHRAAGDPHHQALRALGNRLVGILHGCLRHHTKYDEHTAWSHRQNMTTADAA